MDALLPGKKPGTISSELDAEQWLTSRTGQFNQRTEGLVVPIAGLVILV